MIPYSQLSQINGGKAMARNRWKGLQNALGKGLLKFQAKPSVKGPEWDPNVRPLDPNGRPIYTNTDDILKQLMREDPRWIPRPQIPPRYQIRPIPQQPPSPQNTGSRPLTPNPDSKSRWFVQNP